MKKHIEQLKKVLEQQIEVYKDILDLSINKTNVVVNGHIKKLEEITEEEQKLIIKIGKFEDIRENIIHNMKAELGIEIELNMTTLNDYLEEADKVFIENVKDQLMDILNQLKERNVLNGSLINDSLEYINLNIDLLTNSTIENTYDNSQQDSKGTQARRLFDTKA